LMVQKPASLQPCALPEYEITEANDQSIEKKISFCFMIFF
jgi:hypothetical protein